MTEGFAAANAWTAATELLRAEGRLSNPQNAFIRLVQPLATVDDKFIVSVGSDFIKDWILEHVAPVMVPQLTAILGRNVHLVITVDPALSEQAEISSSSASTTANSALPTANVAVPSLDSEHSFSPEPTHPHTPTFSEETTFQLTEQQNENYFAETTATRRDIPFLETNIAYASQTFTEKTEESHISYPSSATSSTQKINSEKNLPSFSNTIDKSGLNPRYTFDNFVIGDSNRFAHATALAVSDDPGKIYNPLFLYSDSGMGKTHLLHAIGNSVRMTNPEKRVRYTSSEEFMNAFINALRDKHQREFKDEFRNVDVLLIDDIQFLAQAENTVEEFFHTFNVLSTADKQIVITSDVAPHLLHGFNDRMISRFASGITASIDVPSLETRIAILEKKSLAEQMTVPRAVLEYIASKMTSSVRDIEGALRRVAAYGDLSGEDVTVELADFVLKDIFNDPSSIQITAGIIMAQTANYFDISVEDLKSPTRTRSLTVPRHIAMYLCREMTDLSLPKIAEVFDRRDHTTVLNALKNIEQHMTTDQRLYNHLSELTTRIKQSAKQQGQK
ncbi:MAG: chromosomal replication initiator protein DnaA [Arcanobacterium sp.]|nr:chromosomal replication initiator protein DnaA [Arcanobacterium sp.]